MKNTSPPRLCFYRIIAISILRILVLQLLFFGLTDLVELSLRQYTLAQFPLVIPIKTKPSEICYGGKFAHMILNLIKRMRRITSIQSILPIPSPPLLYTLLPSYDFIVIGSGSGGSLVAGRLADHHNVTVLLVEAGGPAVDGLLSPELLPLNSLSNQITDRDWQYRTTSQKAACLAQPEQVSYWPRGKVLGGTSVLNFMIHHRGHPSDFDLWSDCLQDEIWSSKNVARRFKKIENVMLDQSNNDPPRPTRGTEGAIPVSTKKPLSTFSEAFLTACKALDYPNATFYNSWETNAIGAGPLELNKDLLTGQRVTAYRAYVHQKKKKGLLHILPYTHVTRIILNTQKKKLNPTAVAIEFSIVTSKLARNNNPNELNKRRRQRIKANKEIILSAGAIGTPQILMLSGIGPADELNDSLLVNLSAVGKNLMDHVFFPTMFSPHKSRKLRSELLSYRNALTPSSLLQYILSSKAQGMLSSPGCDVQLIIPHLSHLKPRTQPEFCGSVNERFKQQPDLQLLLYGGLPDIWDLRGKMNIAMDSPMRFGAPIDWGVSRSTSAEFKASNLKLDLKLNKFRGVAVNLEIIMMLPVLLHPESRGSIKLKSKNPFDHPIIDPQYLTNNRDVKGIVEGVKVARQLMLTKEWRQVISTYMRPNCPDVTNSSLLNYTNDNEWAAPDIPEDQRKLCKNFDPESDEFLEEIVRLQTLTLYHPAGTCRMGSSTDPMACVNSRLQVRGVRNLRVADASVFPTLTSGNTQLPVMLVAETLVELIAAEYKLTAA